MVKTVTVVAWQALPAVFPTAGRSIGGLETAAWQFARALASRQDWEVRLVVRSTRRRSVAMVDGVEILPMVDRWLSIRRQVAQCIDLPNRRLIQFRPRLLWQVPLLAMRWPWRQRDISGLDADPRLQHLLSDAWIALGVSRESAAVISTATAQGKPSLLMIQSAEDLSEDFLSSDPTAVSAYGEQVAVCRFAIENATVVVCQARYQQHLLHARFGREGELIRNPIDLQQWAPGAKQNRPVAVRPGPYVLWIGRYETFHKRIDRALEIAARCPEITFCLVANPSDPQVEAFSRQTCPSNVTLIDYVPHDQMPAVFAQARVFLATGSGSYEGFPNVLLQAAASKTPIVSLEDFDEFLESSGSGTVSGLDPQQAAEQIQRYWSGQATIDRAAVQSYLERYHSPANALHQLVKLVDSLL